MEFFTMQKGLNEIQDNPTYKQIMADSFGGIMYNVANRGKYDTAELMQKWDALEPVTREMAGGIMKGAFNFLQEKI